MSIYICLHDQIQSPGNTNQITQQLWGVGGVGVGVRTGEEGRDPFVHCCVVLVYSYEQALCLAPKRRAFWSERLRHGSRQSEE